MMKKLKEKSKMLKKVKTFIVISIIIILLHTLLFAHDFDNYWQSGNRGIEEGIAEGLEESVKVMMVVTLSSFFVSFTTSLIINEVGYKKTKRKSSFWGTFGFSILGGVAGATPFYFAGKSRDQEAQKFYSNLGKVTLPTGIIGGAFGGYFIFLEDKKEKQEDLSQINFVFEEYSNDGFYFERPHVPSAFSSDTFLRDGYKLISSKLRIREDDITFNGLPKIRTLLQ